MDRKYNCTVPSCKTRRENGFVTIPRFGSSLAQQRIKNLWIERLQLREPSKFAKICTDHFLHEDFTKNLKRYNGRLKLTLTEVREGFDGCTAMRTIGGCPDFVPFEL